jgi:glycosyltransferase involved in cell wall biosynthesis
VSGLKTVLFYRDFRRFAGHHLKVFDYFEHVLASSSHIPLIRFSRASLWDDSNPWRAFAEHVVDSEAQIDPDLYFFSGMDWRELPTERRTESPVPVINYIQSVRHVWPDNPRHDLLGSRAIRIGVSPEVTEALADTGLVNGPLVTIPAAIDFAGLASARRDERDTNLGIVALKTPELGRSVAERLRRPGRTIRLVDRLVPRGEFLDAIARSEVTLFLPYRVEGAPLPILEGMALGTVVVCPDVVGNRSYGEPGVNSFRPPYEEEAIVAATEEALGQWPDLGEMIAAGEQTARDYDLPAEREAFLRLLGEAETLWADDSSP